MTTCNPDVKTMAASHSAGAKVIPIKVVNDASVWSEKVKNALRNYKLPGNPDTDEYITPVSGGADSAVTAILLRAQFPQVNFRFVYSETFADDSGVLVTLNQLEAYLGRPIERLVPEKGLYDLIDAYGGFLPNASARWCTRVLKKEPFEPWLQQFAGKRKYIFVGIRADEDFRVAFTMPESETEFPLLTMGLDRQDVFRLLSQTIGVPRYYTYRSRSSCESCFFMRRYEIVGLLQEKPKQFQRAASYEKLTDTDAKRHTPAPPLSLETGISENWLALPMPPGDPNATPDARKLKNRMRAKPTLFGDVGIYIGVEFFVESLYAFGGGEIVFHKRVVSYSPALHGIKGQLDERYQHILATSEVYEMEQADVPHQVRFAIYYLELPHDVFDVSGPGDGSYTWQKGTSYNQLRHIIQWATRTLQAEQMRQEAAVKAHPMSVLYEWAESAQKGLGSMCNESGRIVHSEWYKPVTEKKVLSVQEEVKRLPCPMCSI